MIIFFFKYIYSIYHKLKLYSHYEIVVEYFFDSEVKVLQ